MKWWLKEFLVWHRMECDRSWSSGRSSIKRSSASVVIVNLTINYWFLLPKRNFFVLLYIFGYVWLRRIITGFMIIQKYYLKWSSSSSSVHVLLSHCPINIFLLFVLLIFATELATFGAYIFVSSSMITGTESYRIAESFYFSETTIKSQRKTKQWSHTKS